MLWTGTEESTGTRTDNPSDVLFFNGVAADPSDGYTARRKSRLRLADIGVRQTVELGWGWSASVTFGELIESLDMLSSDSGEGVEAGFFSQTHNEFYGAQLGIDRVV